jgi:septal ring factor EnvC (AmiA/AmiB activator)
VFRPILNSQFTILNSFLIATLSLLAMAQSPSPDQQREADLSRIRARIGALKQQLGENEKHAASLSEEIKRLDWKLEIGEQEQKLVAARRDEIGRQLAATAADRAVAATAADASRRALAARARVLHRFGRYGYFRLLLEARDVPGFLQGMERLDALARRDGRLLTAHRAAQSRLDDDLAREKTLKSELDALYANSRRELASTATLRRHREALLGRERSSSATRRDEMAALSDKAARLERLLDTLARQSSQEPEEAGRGIRPWKGVLDWPARGALVETFGRHRHPRFDAWTISNGIAIGLPAGSPVRAVYAGKAVYAQWLAEYGNLVILDHGDGVFTLYAWLQTVGVTAGSRVAAGAELGTAGSGPGREETGVYFEVRDRQKAVDPVAWLR